MYLFIPFRHLPIIDRNGTGVITISLKFQSKLAFSLAITLEIRLCFSNPCTAYFAVVPVPLPPKSALIK